MKREELKKILEEYWYDNQYLNEKAKEINKMEKILNNEKDSKFLLNTKQYEEDQMLKIIEKKKYIESLIQNLSQPYRTIMYMKYISFLTFDQIAGKMNYSTKRIYQLHSEGLTNLLTIINSKSAKH